jgi:PfaD family protein
VTTPLPSTAPASERLAQLCAAYGAQEAVLETAAGHSSASGTGGGLVATVERVGLRPALGVLGDGETLVLRDKGATLRLRRAGALGRLRVEWHGGPVFQDELLVPEGAVTLPTATVDRLAASSPVPAPAPAPARRAVPAVAPLERESALDALSQPLDVAGGALFPVGAAPGPVDGRVPAVEPGDLGSASFRAAHGVRAAYVAGAMAGGIASPALVEAMAREGLLGFYGAGGLPLEQVASDVAGLRARLSAGASWGANLLHNPDEPAVEERTVDCYIGNAVPAVSASAFMMLTPAVLRFRFSGLESGPDGQPRGLRPIFAKVSRAEVAERFLSPPPERMLAELVERGSLTATQARLAATLPVAEDITAEADSGGHTDRRPLLALLPTLLRLRDRLAAAHGYSARGLRPRIGAAGGIGSPAAVHAAFALGADYVLTGSINQATREAGTSEAVKAMLAEAAMTDVAMGPAPDMFELGAHVQVLSRGSMYAQRARKLYELYVAYDDLDALPAKQRARLERTVFQRPLADVEAETLAFWDQRDPARAEKARQDGKLRMALTFRWYLGLSSRWARSGEPGRVRDYQIWCGPAMGAFNDWARGTPLEAPEARTVGAVAWALLRGAARLERGAIARRLGA